MRFIDWRKALLPEMQTGNAERVFDAWNRLRQLVIEGAIDPSNYPTLDPSDLTALESLVKESLRPGMPIELASKLDQILHDMVRWAKRKSLHAPKRDTPATCFTGLTQTFGNTLTPNALVLKLTKDGSDLRDPAVHERLSQHFEFTTKLVCFGQQANWRGLSCDAIWVIGRPSLYKDLPFDFPRLRFTFPSVWRDSSLIQSMSLGSPRQTKQQRFIASSTTTSLGPATVQLSTRMLGTEGVGSEPTMQYSNCSQPSSALDAA